MVTVWCPDWPVTAAEVAPDVPAIVLFANRIVARSPAAAAEGVAIGQRRRIAQQRCPDAVLLDHDPDRDARAFEPVVRAVSRFAPRLEVVEPGWLCLAARGPSRYFGGDERLAEQLVASVTNRWEPRSVTKAQVGIADGRFTSAVAARLAARHPVVVAPSGSADFLAPLPVAWLSEVGEIDAELVGLFARLGLARLGDLAALPAGDVLARFGPPGRHAHRLASGSDDRPADAADPPTERRVEHSFDDPVTALDTLGVRRQAPRRRARRRARRRGPRVHPLGGHRGDRTRRTVRTGLVPGGGDVSAGDGRAGALAARRLGQSTGRADRGSRPPPAGARRGPRRRR